MTIHIPRHKLTYLANQHVALSPKASPIWGYCLRLGSKRREKGHGNDLFLPGWHSNMVERLPVLLGRLRLSPGLAACSMWLLRWRKLPYVLPPMNSTEMLRE